MSKGQEEKSPCNAWMASGSSCRDSGGQGRGPGLPEAAAVTPPKASNWEQVWRERLEVGCGPGGWG